MLNVLRAQYCHEIVTYEYNRARFTVTKRVKDFKEFGTIYPNHREAAKKD